MPPKRDQQLLIEAARLYYLENLDQGEVGERLGLSRSAVSRILARAKDEGIIEVRIIGDDYVPRNRELEARLMSAYGLREAQVAQTGELQPSCEPSPSLAARCSLDGVQAPPGLVLVGD